MSNRLFQTVIHQMRDAIDRTIGVVDDTSIIIASSDLSKVGEVCEWNGFRFKVKSMDGVRVEKILITKLN